MKIIKLNNDFTINYGNLIDENSEQGIKQAVYEVLRSIKNFDIYNLNTGIDYNVVNYEYDYKNRLISDIRNQLSAIPYITHVSNIDVKKNDDNKISLSLMIYYIDNNNLNKSFEVQHTYV